MILPVEVLRQEAESYEQKQRKKYKATPELLSALEVLLQEVYEVLCPKPRDYDVRRDLIRIFNVIVKEIYDNASNAPVVEVFGSFTMDLFCAKSDLDLSVNFTNRNDNISREEKIQVLRKFAKKFYFLQRNGHVSGVNPITSAKVPVLKVVDRGSKVECDISVENQDGILKSKILCMIGTIDERFRKLCFLMKAWAKAQRINSAKDRTLNSLSVILLVAFHLQTRNPPILPPFSSLFRDGNDPAAVARSLSMFLNFGVSNKESVAELFFSLLTKLLPVEKLWSSGLCVSTYEGSWISKTWGSKVGHINVEDFSDRSQNVARAVGPAQVKRIYSCIQSSVQHISDFLNKKIEGNALEKFLFGQEVAPKLISVGNVKSIAKEIQTCSFSKKKEIQTCPEYIAESSRAKPQGKRKRLRKSKQIDSVTTKRTRTDECLGGTSSELRERQPEEGLVRQQQAISQNLTKRSEPVVDRQVISRGVYSGERREPVVNRQVISRGVYSGERREPVVNRQVISRGVYSGERREPVVNRQVMSREGVYSTPHPVSFDHTYRTMRLTGPFREVHGREIITHPNLFTPAAPHAYPSSTLYGNQTSYRPPWFPPAYSNMVSGIMHSSSGTYFSPPDPRRF